MNRTEKQTVVNRPGLSVNNQVNHNNIVNLTQAIVLDEMYQVLWRTLSEPRYNQTDDEGMPTRLEEIDALEQIVFEIEDSIRDRIHNPQHLIYPLVEKG